MRLSLIIVGAFAAIVCIERPAAARDYPWCAYYNFRHGGGATNCGWETFEQCLATVRGIGGAFWAQPVCPTPPRASSFGREPKRDPFFRPAPQTGLELVLF